MKYLLFVALALATVPAAAQMQPPPPVHFKGANTILVATTDSVRAAWQLAQANLLAKGYSVAQSNEALHSFSSVPKPVGNGRQLTITGYARRTAGGSEIAYSGFYSYEIVTVATLASTTINRPISWGGGGLGVDTKMFERIEAVAQAYPRRSKPLDYQRR